MHESSEKAAKQFLAAFVHISTQQRAEDWAREYVKFRASKALSVGVMDSGCAARLQPETALRVAVSETESVCFQGGFMELLEGYVSLHCSIGRHPQTSTTT